MSVLSAEYLHNEAAAYAYIEAHLWENGRPCPHCGVVDQSGALKGNTTRIGLYKCYACRKPFTVKVGTIFESSHIKLHIWLQAIFLISSSKKGISTNQLHRTLGVTLKSAWFLSHRIREAMASKGALPPIGGEGATVEVDETYIGTKDVIPTKRGDGLPYKFKRPTGVASKRIVVSLVQRGGEVRSFHIARADKQTIAGIVVDNVARESRLMTDESKLYRGADAHVAEHHTINHGSKQYVRGEVHTNTVEGYFSVFKRGMRGTYQHCAGKHMHRYLAEFDFRYNNRASLDISDAARASKIVSGVVGKRLTYQRTKAG